MKRIALSLTAVLCACAAAFGQAPTTTSTQVMVMKAAPAAPAGFRAEYVAEIDRVGQKLVDLAEAMPAGKYSWRPGPGVRSVAEVYMHVVISNSRIRSFLGLPPMEGLRPESEKITDKAQIVSLLKKSIENVRAAVANLTNADLDKSIKTASGREMTDRQVLLLIITHMHEHLGQSIAYARMNGVTPPWSKGD